jgi:hypothetical protein
MTTHESLCESCVHLREVVSGKGSRFLLCSLSLADRCYAKYPRQPVLGCMGYARRLTGQTPGEQPIKES